MEFGLTGKRVVVIGAGKGIGLAITRGFAAAGAHVVAGSRHASAELKELANQGAVTPVEVDPPSIRWPGQAGRGRGRSHRCAGQQRGHRPTAAGRLPRGHR